MSRYRMYPDAEQQTALVSHCDHARFIWNLGHEQRLMWASWKGSTPGLNEQMRQLTEARAVEPWLRQGSQTVQQQALRDLDRAWLDFFIGRNGRPKWRKRTTMRHQGFRIVGWVAGLVRVDSARWAAVKVPKVGWVRFRLTRPLPDQRKSYRVTRDASGRWHIAFAAIPAATPGPGTGEIVGVDRGVKVAAALSTGEMTSPAGLRAGEAERLLRLQRRLSRADKGSNRRERLRAQVARMMAREKDRRKDWVEKTSTDLAERFDVIRLEALSATALVRTPRRVEGGPRRNVAQKRALSRQIMKSGWGLLFTRLDQKAPGRVEAVNPAYTSQTCNACKHVAPESRKSQAVFECVACGHRDNADVNAAKNIAEREPAVGRTVAARGDSGLLGSVKREPETLRLTA